MLSHMVRLGVAAGAAIVFATAGAPPALAADCAELAKLKIDETDFLSATIVPRKAPLPEYCRVLGYVRPAVHFEIRLPTKDWNGKFFMAGCGGFCGKLDSDNMDLTNGSNVGLMRNYATVSMDSGHWGATLADGRWAYTTTWLSSTGANARSP